MKSMTGFGRGVYNDVEADLTFTVEISSINRKQLDIRTSLSNELSALDTCLRNRICECLSRGAVNAKATVHLGPAATRSAMVINEAMLESLVDKARNLGSRLGLDESMQLKDFLALPGVIEIGGIDYTMPDVASAFSRTVDMALNELVRMKTMEGDNISVDIKLRLGLLRETLEQIEPLAAGIPAAQRDKLLQRLENAGLPLDVNDERILREVVIYCDRADVTEEITRLRSHFLQFESYLNNKDEAIGRSLDFLIQEINREITTLGNKAAGCEVSPLVVRMKTELEKIREQVQNVE